MTKVLVTGANGYIGSNFIHKYKNKYQFDRFSFLTDRVENLNFDGIDIIVHCAALVHQKIKHSYEMYYQANVVYPIALAKLAKKAGVQHFVFMSTIAVYDENIKYIQDDSLLRPLTPYGKSKLEAEKQLQALEDNFFLVSIVRSPLVYGTNAPGNIQRLIKLIDKMPILPFKKIQNQRSFVYIGNLCAMIDRIIQTKSQGIFLTSDDVPISTSKLVELIIRAKKKKKYLFHSKLFEKMLLWLNPSLYQRLFGNLVIDTSQTQMILDFKNPYNTEDGIQIMVQGEKE